MLRNGKWIVLLGGLALAGCAGQKHTEPRAQVETVFVADQLAQLDALARPDKIDAATWAELKSALRQRVKVELMESNPPPLSAELPLIRQRVSAAVSALRPPPRAPRFSLTVLSVRVASLALMPPPLLREVAVHGAARQCGRSGKNASALAVDAACDVRVDTAARKRGRRGVDVRRPCRHWNCR